MGSPFTSSIAPFYLIDDTGIYGFPMFVLAAYFLLGIELVAEEVEEPFGPGGDNLPLERYCATIAVVARNSGPPGKSISLPIPNASRGSQCEIRDSLGRFQRKWASHARIVA